MGCSMSDAYLLEFRSYSRPLMFEGDWICISHLDCPVG